MNNIQRILVFDVETNGLLPKKHTGHKTGSHRERSGSGLGLDNFDINLLPHILQLSFAVYDTISEKIIKSYNQYIRPHPDVEISEKITGINGISRELVNKVGCDITEALAELYLWYSECDAIVAHNLEFDSRMILLEIKRNYAKLVAMDESKNENMKITPYICWMFSKKYCDLTDIRLICTMQNSVNLCNIKRENSRGAYTKFPTLCELYQYLFDKTPENLHNSMIDVLVCLRCYLKLEFDMGISDEMFSHYLEKCL